MLSWLPGVLSQKLAALRSSQDSLVPPARLVQNVGGGSFTEVGREFLKYFVDLAHLRPADVILDVGCGCGRIAAPLTRYLTSGRYCGFDVDPRGVDWCQKHISSRFPHFQFERANVYNQVYNRAGAHQASAYRFPHPHGTFDFVCLTSVFTHMQWPEMHNYLRETARALKPGGTGFCTYFLIDAQTRNRLSANETRIDFPVPADRCRLHRADKPEWAVAFELDRIEEAMEELGLEIQNPIRLGSWRGGPGLSYQDIIIVKKRPSDSGKAELS